MNTKIDGRLAVLLIVLIGGWIVLTRLGEAGPTRDWCAGMPTEVRKDCEKR